MFVSERKEGDDREERKAGQHLVKTMVGSAMLREGKVRRIKRKRTL
jgi:hypothetical protein